MAKKRRARRAKGHGGFRKRGNSSYQIYYQDGEGKVVYETITAYTDGQADIELRKRITSVEEGRILPTKTRQVTLDDLFYAVDLDYQTNGHKSIDDIRGRFKHLREHLGAQKRAIALTTLDIREYAKVRQTEGAANGTINRELEALKRAYHLGVDDGRLAIVPKIPMLKEDNIRTGFFEPAMLEKMVESLPAHLGPFLRFAYITGWRREEIANLTPASVDFEADVVRLEPGKTKNGQGREFPIIDTLKDLVVAQVEAAKTAESAYLFFAPGDEKHKPRKIGSFRKTWLAALTAAGVEVEIEVVRKAPTSETAIGKLSHKRVKLPLIFHDFRRTAIRNLELRGMPRAIAKKLVGHKTDSTYNRYAISTASDINVARQILNQVLTDNNS